ncbi:unnamed protein product [Somion occarium]|uniref:Uncharacterized protein n=1 Tax=Somion occarium TaxID=3059160 RepID=A0ABP1DAU4_9APHY
MDTKKAYLKFEAEVSLENEALVKRFNHLAMKRTTQLNPRPCSHEPRTFINNWYFDVRPITLPFGPHETFPAEMLVIFNGSSRRFHAEGPFRVFDDTRADPDSLKRKAEWIAKLLVRAFAKQSRMEATGIFSPGSRRTVPWTWSTGDERVRSAIQDALRALGVRQQLCTVGLEGPLGSDRRMADEQWTSIRDALIIEVGKIPDPRNH